MADLGLFVRVQAQGVDSAQSDLDKIAITADKYDKVSEKATKSTKNLTSGINDLGNKASDSSRNAGKLAQEVERVGKSADRANRTLGLASKAIAGFITVDAIRRTIDLADNYGQMSARIKLAIESMEEYDYVQNRLLDTANKAQRPLEEIQNIFIDTSGNIREMGYSLNEAMSVADSFTYALVRNATSAQRAESALRAYDIALNKGKVDGMMWQSISSAIPSLEVSMSKMFDVPLQKVQQMGLEGKITADMLTKAFLHSYDENKRAAESMGTTVAGAFTEMRNNISKFVGELNESTSATTGIANSISYIANNLEVILVPAFAVASVMMGRLTASITGNAIAYVRATAESVRYQMALARMAGVSQTTAVALTASTAAARGLSTAMSFLGGPIGLIATVVAGFAAYAISTKKASLSTDELKSKIFGLNQSIGELTANQALAAKQDLTKDFIATKQKAEELQKELDRVNEGLEKLPKLLAAGNMPTDRHERYAKSLEMLKERHITLKAEIDTANQSLRLIGGTIDDLTERARLASGMVIKFGTAWSMIKEMTDEKLEPEWATKPSSGKSSADYFGDSLRSLTAEIYNLKAVNDDLVLFGFESQYTKVREITQELNDQKGVLAGITTAQREILLNKAQELDSHKQINAILALRGEYKQNLEDMLFEVGMIGRTQKEIEKLSFFRELDNKAKAISIGMSAENVKVLEAEIEKVKELYGAYEKAKEQVDNSVAGGIGRGMRQYQENAGEMADQIANYVEGTFTHMENALFDFARTSKFEFGEMSKAILEDLSRLLIKMGMVNAMMQGMQAMKGAGGVWGSFAGMLGFADGGYTGFGGKYEPAGIVHKGEVVFSQADIRRHGGLSKVEQLRLKGYSDGGIVGGHRQAAQRGNSSGGEVAIHQSWTIHYEGENSGGLDEEKIAKLMRDTAKDEAIKVIRNQKRAGGAL